MKSQDIRQSFLDFFAERDHLVLPSAPLVPHGDPTLLFTNAGMVQFKDVFLGLETLASPRAVTSQKCLRVSGKHNDLENVGPSHRHHTFFEMLGNFSFGDYFKEDAIRFGWDLVTGPWGLDPAHLYATVFEEDDEAAQLWAEVSGLPPERILRCGAKDNFWAMGETGPCGPCSEIFVDRAPHLPPVDWEEGSEEGRYLEIWNLVFMQFERDAEGELRPLPNPSIDTGAGLERVSAVLQGVESNYDTDLFRPILDATAKAAGTTYGADPDRDVSMRVIADHLRAVSFLLADGVIPGPDGRGYVLRRLLRRAVRHGGRLGFEEPFLSTLVGVLGDVMGGHYPELAGTRTATEATLREEEEKYLATRAAGARRIQEVVDRTRSAGGGTISGDDLFRLYDTHGLELDAVREIAEEERLALDIDGFEERLEERRRESRDVTGEHQERMASLRRALHDEAAEPTTFGGYDRTASEGARVVRLAVQRDDQAAEALALEAGDRGVVVLDRTVFYAESGGQVGDTGWIRWEGGSARVDDTQKDRAGVWFHFVEVLEGRLEREAEVSLEVETSARRATERNHTATHLLHAALHEVLGDGARQAGSLVAPDRLRFDFTHSRPVSSEELRRVEDIVNARVREATALEIAERSHAEAIEAGAMALFGEKYGDRVRTVEIPGFSLELCGGCHVRNTGEIGLFLVTGERGVASGVRRIEAVTGEGALALVRNGRERLDHAAAVLGTEADRLAEEAAGVRSRVKELEKELAALRAKLVAGAVSGEPEGESEVDGIKVVAREAPAGSPTDQLRDLADTLRDKLGAGVVVLGARDEGKVSLVVTVRKELTGRLRAGDLVKVLAKKVGGGGGGRPDFAQAGGREPEKLGAALAEVPDVVRAQLGG